jgi:hypothetical protein
LDLIIDSIFPRANIIDSDKKRDKEKGKLSTIKSEQSKMTILRLIRYAYADNLIFSLNYFDLSFFS